MFTGSRVQVPTQDLKMNMIRRCPGGEIVGSKKNTPAGDELEVWVTLIEAYEKEKYPNEFYRHQLAYYMDEKNPKG